MGLPPRRARTARSRANYATCMKSSTRAKVSTRHCSLSQVSWPFSLSLWRSSSLCRCLRFTPHDDGRTYGEGPTRMTEKHEANRGIARFQIVFLRDGRYAWQLINPHVTPAARSMVSYDTEDAAFAA